MATKEILTIRWVGKTEENRSVEKSWDLETDTVTLNQYRLNPNRLKREATLFGPLLDDVMNMKYDIKYPISIFYQGKLFHRFVISYRHYRYRHFMDIIYGNPMLGNSKPKRYDEDFYILHYMNFVRSTQAKLEEFVWKIADKDYNKKDIERHFNRLSNGKAYPRGVAKKSQITYEKKQVVQKHINENAAIQPEWVSIKPATNHE